MCHPQRLVVASVVVVMGDDDGDEVEVGGKLMLLMKSGRIWRAEES